MSYTVAIVGRPNVGKSTLFNRFLEERKAIVDDISGVTRDRQYGVTDWNGKSFNVIDTGGFVPDSSDMFETEIRKQVKIAIDEANAIIFMVDAATGLTDLDDAMADMLRRTTKPVYVTVNKVDNSTRALEGTEFYSMGFEHNFFISSISGSGTGELLDAVTADIKEEPKAATATEELPEGAEPEEAPSIPKIAIVGQPNAGKSSLLNAMIGQERTIVSEIAGTTRDTIHTHYNMFQKEFMLIDTAGIRRKNKEKDDLEFYSVIRAIKAMDEADVCLLVLDAEKGVTAQDLSIFSLAIRKGKGIVVLVNKWDLVEKESNTHLEYTENIRKEIAPFVDVPIMYVSALTKQRVFQGMETILQVYENLSLKIPTRALNDYLLPIMEATPPPSKKGKFVKVKYVTQLPSKRVAFALFCNLPQYVAESYTRFLENKMREKFPLSGVPISLFYRKK